MANCFDVAKYFLSLMDEEAGDTISNMKIQKLVYYAQGFSLALFDEPLFDENIKAWDHGPVVPELYHAFKENGSACIPKPEGLDLDVLTERQKELLDEVWEVFGQFSAWKLRNMTHEESPWKNASDAADDEITQESMKKYFKRFVTDG